MRKLTMVKSMTKAIFALGIALSIFVCNPANAFAAVCSDIICPNGVHDFRGCCQESEGYSCPELTHAYLYGYDHNGEEIYRTCEVTYHYKYCHYVCKYCGLRESMSERHYHLVKITHSVNHP